MLGPITPEDIVAVLRRLVPTRADFKHRYGTPADTAGHTGAAVIGHSFLMAVENSDLAFGGSPGILWYAFDGPRARRVQVKVIAG